MLFYIVHAIENMQNFILWVGWLLKIKSFDDES